MARSADRVDLRRSIERHYDSLALLYRAFWGEHIHHGLWLSPSDPPRQAQVQLVEHLADRARIRNQERVLDVGCGYGATGRWLSGRFGCHVTGITISQAQARLARRLNARAVPGGRVSVLRGDAAYLPFARESFDVLWIIECIEHLSDKRRFVEDAARLLRPGGRLALCTWQRGEASHPTDPLVQAVCDAFLCPCLATSAEYRSWCADVGLEILRVEDLTAQVSPTWEVLVRRLGRPWLAPLKLLVRGDVRRFVDGFQIILEAYRSRAMSYGLLVARRP